MAPARKGTAPPPDFETFEVVSERLDNLCARLERSGSDDASALAGKLLGCRNGGRCRSAACPKCNRLFRKQLHREIVRAVPQDMDIVRISLIPKHSRIEVGGLAAFDLRTWVSSRQRSIDRALPSGSLFVGGVDMSLNTMENSDAHWVPHLYGFVIAPKAALLCKRRKRDDLRRALLKHCPVLQQPPGSTVRQRPLVVSSLWTRADFEANALYAHKSEAYRRSRYWETKRATGKRTTNVVSQRLSADQDIELALCFDRFALGSRLILHGLRRRGHFATFKLERI
jgi:hypothetical protein